MRMLINSTSRFFYNRSLGILLIRVMAGLIFLSHGWMKVETISHVVVMFAGLGFWPWVGYVIAWLEVVGGLALILGVATRVFGVLFGIEMLVAAFLVSAPRGFNAMGFELLLAAVSFGTALMGSGRYSVFKMECSTCGGMLCNGSTGVCVVRT